MPRYLVETTHTAGECLKALDDISAHDVKLLDSCQFGCKSGNHTGWAFLEGANEVDVKARLPQSLRQKARVVAVERFTVDQIRSYHEKTAQTAHGHS